MATIAAAVVPMAVKEAFDLGQALVERLFPDKEKQAAERAAAMQHVQDLAQQRWQSALQAVAQSDTSQAEIVKTDVASPHWLQSGPHAAILWICALALFSDYIARPYVTAFAHVEIPAIDWSVLSVLMFGMLGIGTLHSMNQWKAT
jgi:hypothetical protein